MKKGILGRKVGMTQVFTKDGVLIPVTVIEVTPNIVMQVKTVETDGYNAIQLGVVDKKEKSANKQEIGHSKKANTTPKRFLKELRNVEGEYTQGQSLKADVFEVGEIVDVTGTSKGKGFQGVIKRHNQNRGPMGHGSHYHRGPGSMGTMLPKRVLKGKRLPGHMGNVTITIQNLQIIEVNAEENYLLVSGNIPGAKNSLVLIKSAVKNNKKKADFEVISYVEETVVDKVEEVEVADATVVEDTPVETEVTDAEESAETAEEETTESTEETAETVEQPVETEEEQTEEVAEETTEETSVEEEN